MAFLFYNINYYVFIFSFVVRSNSCPDCLKLGAANQSLQAEISLARNMLLAAQMHIDTLNTEVLL